MIRMISVDPGVGGTGYAYWHDSELVTYGTIHFHQNCETWEQRMRDVGFGFLQMLKVVNVANILVMESPVFMRGFGGYTVASTGDLVKLAMLTGHLTARVYDRSAWTKLELVEPSKWKGQLPKKVVENRVRKLLPGIFDPKKKVSNHAFDAIGIGLWKLGKL